MSRDEAKERRRAQVLAAAERSIREQGNVDFSMKELARNADVSFATPFNLFGKKEDILAALFNRRVSEQAKQSNRKPGEGSSLENLLRVGEDSCNAYLADAELFRPLARAFRTQSTPQLQAISKQAEAIWKQALVGCQDERILAADRDLDALAHRLHVSFRVAFWMWAADDLSDAQFRQQALTGTLACLLSSATETGKRQLLSHLESLG